MMIRLLKADGYRFWRKKMLHLLVGATLILAALLVQTAEATDAQTVALNVLKNGSMLLPLLFIPIYLFAWQSDFASRAVNHVLISGVSRRSYYFGKLTVAYLIGTLFVIAYDLSTFVTAYVRLGSFDLASALSSAFLQLLLYYVLLTVGLAIFSLTNSVSVSTTVYILFVLMGENLLALLMNQLNLDTVALSEYFLFQNLTRVLDPAGLDAQHLLTVAISGLVIWMLSMLIGLTTLAGKELK